MHQPATQKDKQTTQPGTNSERTTSPVYQHLTPHMAWLLAAPHTWPASIIPVLLAASAASAKTGTLSVSMTCALLIACVLMQSAVNTLNDYFDYVKGTDSADDNVDPSDAVLIYNNINPKAALRLAIGFLVAAFAFGAYAIAYAGWIPLAIGIVGALVVFLYSGGKTPISYLPIGEIVSGFVMGGLIMLACYHVLTLDFDLAALVWALPAMIGIALIMFTNNTCDIEKDREAQRKTLAAIVGRKKAVFIYHALMYAWIVAIVVITAIWFTNGLIIMPFMLLGAYPLLKALHANPLVSASRIGAMAQICSVNIALGAFYAAAMLANGGLILAF